MPSLRHTSSTGNPDSDCLKANVICSCVNLFLLMVLTLSVKTKSYQNSLFIGPTFRDKTRMTRAEAACGDAVRDQIRPAMESEVEAVLGPNEQGWFEFLTDPGTNSPVLLFHYPSLQPAGFDYLKRSVKLEFGSLTDQQPVGRHPVKPWVAEVLPDAFPDWRCEVVA